jgi:hypothetical protein
VIDENGAATGSMGAINITPAIANKKAALQIDVMAGGGAQQHAGLRLSAIARIAVPAAGVKTNFDAIEKGERPAQSSMQRVDYFTALSAAPNVRLIGDHDQKKPGFL